MRKTLGLLSVAVLAAVVSQSDAGAVAIGFVTAAVAGIAVIIAAVSIALNLFAGTAPADPDGKIAV